MSKVKTNYEKLCSYYDTELKKCHEFSFKYDDINLDYFITYLRFIRDRYILTEEEIDPNKNIKVASICLAVSEYEKYMTCISNYYKTDNRTVSIKDTTKTPEETAAAYAKEKLFHWNAFWEVIKINMESWLSDDITN